MLVMMAWCLTQRRIEYTSIRMFFDNDIETIEISVGLLPIVRDLRTADGNENQ